MVCLVCCCLLLTDVRHQIFALCGVCLCMHSGPETLKKSRQKKLVKSHKSKFFFVKLHFWQIPSFSQFKNSFLAIFEIAKNGIWSKHFFVKLIYLISRVFLAWTFLIFWPISSGLRHSV